MRLLLVRHATCDPVGHTLSGRALGVHLNAAGIAQAEALAQRLQKMQVSVVYTSPRERAVETGQAIAGATGAPLQLDDRLDEIDFGEWTGRAIPSLEGDDHWRNFNLHRSGTRAPSGELAGEVLARSTAALQAMAEAHRGQHVVAVTHGDVIRYVLCHLLGSPLDLFHRIAIDPASLTIVQLDPWGPRVLSVNEAVRDR